MTDIPDSKGVKNIIFDLGGVILDIDFKKTAEAFNTLGVTDFYDLYNSVHQISLFDDFEIGKISPEKFVNELKTYGPGLTEQNIIDAWNAMLLQFPAGRIEFLQSLQKKYRTFLLSNTNSLHHDNFQKIYLEMTGLEGTLDRCFERAYYSHVMGLRKPGKDIFERILNENGLIAEETLFIDDNLPNVEAARTVNLQTIHLAPPLTIEKALANY